MVNERSFGRRVNSQHQHRRVQAAVEAAPSKKAEPAEVLIQAPLPLPANTEPLSVEDELREWKLVRRNGFQIPWRPLSLMASLCFGVASFALPDSVNDAVNWLLYALAAASLYAGFSRPRDKAKN